MKRFLFFYFAILIISLSSCIIEKPKGKKEKLEIQVWGSYKEVQIIKDSIKKFNDIYPQLKIELSHAPQGEGYVERILTRAVANDLPDIIFCEVNFIDRFIEKNILADLTPYLKKDGDISETDFFPQIINRFKKGKKLYALPRDVAPFACIYYNKSLFDREGIPYPADDWDIYEFLEVAKKLTKGTGVKKQYGFTTWVWKNFIYAFNGKLVDDIKNPKKCLLGKKQAINGMKFYRDLIYKYKVMPSPESVEMGYNQMFMTGKVAMYGSGIWETPIFREIKKFKWDIVMFPKGPEGNRGFATGGSGYAISATSKNKELAFKFLKLIAGKEGELKLAETGLAQPALKELAYSKFWAGDTSSLPVNKKMLNKAVEYIIFNPMISEWQEIEEKIISPRIDLIVRNQLDVEKGLKEAEKEVNKILEKRLKK